MGTRNDSYNAHPLRAATVMAAISLLALGIVYPAVAVIIGQAAFPAQAGGSLIERDGQVIGSELVGQPFEQDAYLIGRPSAVAYDPKSVAGSNLAPSNPALGELIAQRAVAIAQREGIAPSLMPVDAVTASGAGIDPHISPTYAGLQVARIAAARSVEGRQVRAVIERHTQAPSPGMPGQPRVHVLRVNLALDEQFPAP